MKLRVFIDSAIEYVELLMFWSFMAFMKTLDQEDSRKLSPEAQHERRKQVVRMHKRGASRTRIGEETGQSYMGVKRIIDRFEEGGAAAIAPKVRGQRAGEKRLLTAEQEATIRQVICDKRPEQLRMRFALWTRIAAGRLIELQCGVKLPTRTVGDYLGRWGFTPQKPILRAYERCPLAVEQWLQEDYPQIAARARIEGAEIHCGDGSALVTTDVRGRRFAPRGKTPVALHPGKREHLTMVSTVSNQGTMRWMIVDGKFDTSCMIEFLERLIQDAGKKVFLVLDNLRMHHSRQLKAWAAEHAHQIQLFYLPSYSPELNPDERLNADIKQYVGSRVQVRSKDKLKTTTSYHLRLLQQQPERIKSYFQNPRVKYAA